MWAVPYPIINISLAAQINILLHYWIIPGNPPKIRVRGFPERDILSLRTLGLGLARFGKFFRRRRPANFLAKSEVSENQRFFHDWAPEKRSQRATTGKLLGITLRVFF